MSSQATRTSPARRGRTQWRRLDIALQPIVPFRTPEEHADVLVYGFYLRVAGGALLSASDPLLEAFGVRVVGLEDVDEHDEALQHESFDPGQELRLEVEPDDDGANRVAISDAGAIRRAGCLPVDTSACVSAGLEHGLRYRAVVLQEQRRPPDNRRAGLVIVLLVEALATLSRAGVRRYERPSTSSRRRVVLIADGSSKLGWWDGAGDAGPAEVRELPISPELNSELAELGTAIEQAGRRNRRASSGYERYDLELELDALDDRARTLWRRARGELRRSYVVGFLGRGMRRPIWSLEEVEDGDGDDEAAAW